MAKWKTFPGRGGRGNYLDLLPMIAERRFQRAHGGPYALTAGQQKVQSFVSPHAVGDPALVRPGGGA